MGNGLTRLTGRNSQSESNDDESKPAITESVNMSKLLIDESKLRYGCVISHSENTTVHRGSYMDESVAIKVIQKEKGKNVSPSRKEKFHREVRLLAAAKNDNIVKFIGFSLEPAMTLVTEMMKGGSLQRHLWNIRPFTLERKDALVLALEISRAMAYLHENGIIHRDLKPSNIFLSLSKKSVKLGDFGLCREGLDGDFSADVGSYRWMAPEVYSREQHGIGRITTRYNYKVDVYSFAIVVWELFTNKTPFRGKDKNMIAQAVINNERPSLDEENIPEDIHSLLQSCWSNDPLRRPEFRQISELLEEMLNGIEPGWDRIEPSLIASRPDETTTLLGKAKKISTSLFSCFPSCCHSIRTRVCCCCPSCHSIRTRLCCCCPSCHSIRTRLCCCCPSCHSIRTKLCCYCPSCHSIRTRLCCCFPSFHSIRTSLCSCVPSFHSIRTSLCSCVPSFHSIRTSLCSCLPSLSFRRNRPVSSLVFFPIFL